jgi:hypothetical protein
LAITAIATEKSTSIWTPEHSASKWKKCTPSAMAFSANIRCAYRVSSEEGAPCMGLVIRRVGSSLPKFLAAIWRKAPSQPLSVIRW